ncbi:MAG: hypothetical protein QN152_03120 [Armatimonadota bacterium]|nr:hypothetical protein [Armatimonadota bacterium]MDR7463210.1 hypothetical protein [Armatimonadota bacterium]MDR7469410.1 hypothetical protein [Armatimonadota bacterium]MDR7474754.1 hypothetical protein [Armatimonadota bacterium]MDR7538508.1 hypothetical protein [Armatimonadota bacterium]
MTATFLLASLLCLELACVWSAELLVELRVTGGIAGVAERLLVFEDGLARVELGAGRTVRAASCAYLGDGQLRKIRRTLEAAGFEHLQREYVPARPVYDGYAYSVTYRGSTVRALDPLEDAAPPDLRAVIRLLQEVLQFVRAGNRSCDDFLPERRGACVDRVSVGAPCWWRSS